MFVRAVVVFIRTAISTAIFVRSMIFAGTPQPAKGVQVLEHELNVQPAPCGFPPFLRGAGDFFDGRM
jgi:hypothetical protein